jgi:predicted O-linked N-acetylglucosamine transferase (SPINDLY family)
MALMEEADLTLDSYPFGGYNIVADSLYLRKPTVSYQGTKWYNRIGSQMLRQVGLEEMIATSAEDYVNLALKLIDDAQYRQDIHDRLQQVDLVRTVFHSENKQYFKKMVEFLISNHEKLQQQPICETIFIR